MVNNKCSQCGAKVNTSTMTCEYCGTSYQNTKVNSNSSQQKTTTAIISLSDASIISTLTKINPNIVQIIPVIVFMVVWCSIALVMGVIAISQAGAVGIAPFLMFFIGLSFLISLLVSSKKGSITDVISLLKSNNFDSALILCEQKQLNHANYMLAYCLIAVHHYKNYDKVEEKIRQVPVATLTRTLSHTTAFAEIANLYNINISKSPFNEEYFNDFVDIMSKMDFK